QVAWALLNCLAQQIGGGAVIARYVEPPAQLLQPHGSVLFQRIGGEFGPQLLSSRRVPAKQFKAGDRDLQVLRLFSFYRLKRTAEFRRRILWIVRSQGEGKRIDYIPI